jgi:hypothetical protein
MVLHRRPNTSPRLYHSMFFGKEKGKRNNEKENFNSRLTFRVWKVTPDTLEWKLSL